MLKSRNLLYTIVSTVPVLLISLLLLTGCAGSKSPVLPDSKNHSPGNIPEPQSNSETSLITDQNSIGTEISIENPGYVESEVLVVLSDDAPEGRINSLLPSYSLELAEIFELGWGTVYRLKIPEGKSVEEISNSLRRENFVRFAQANTIYTPCAAPYFPNDPYFESDDPGTSPRDGTADMHYMPMMSADIVWNEHKGSEEIIVGILDLGIMPHHEDLRENIWINEDEIPRNGIDDDQNGYIDDTYGWDFYDDDNEPEDMGWGMTMVHGTPMAGIIGAMQDNGKGITGICPNVSLMTLKVGLTTDQVVEGLNYAYENGADVVNMSFGGGFDNIIDETLSYVYDNGNGIILVASSGNSNAEGLLFPAASEWVIGVGGTTKFTDDGQPIDEARISSYTGFSWGANFGENLTMSAPGEWTWVLFPEENMLYWYRQVGGTSDSAAHVTGGAALLKSCFPEASAGWCRERLTYTSDDLLTPGHDKETGYGRLNLLRAVYGPDRFADLEDENGFVSLEVSDEWIWDSIHLVEGNPYADSEDFYSVVSPINGQLGIFVDILTWGEDINIAVYSDHELTRQIAGSTDINHAGSSFESLTFDSVAGEEYFLRIYGAGLGDSSTYGINISELDQSLTISGENIGPDFIHLEGYDVPFLKLEIETDKPVELSEITISTSGTIPLSRLEELHLYVDGGFDGEFGDLSLYLTSATHNDTNRIKFDIPGLTVGSENPLVLFVTADIAEASGPVVEDITLRLSIESYKDVVFMGGIEAPYSDFPIASDLKSIGYETFSPVWLDLAGIASIEPYYGAVVVRFNQADDEHNNPVTYNLYYTDTLPFDFDTAVKIENLDNWWKDYLLESEIWGLPVATELYFILRAEDAIGNEDDNIVMVTTTTLDVAVPSHPVFVRHYPMDHLYDIDMFGSWLLVGQGSRGMKSFSAANAPELVETSHFDDVSAYDVCIKPPLVLTGSNGSLKIFDCIDILNPVQVFYSNYGASLSFDTYGSYAYLVYDNRTAHKWRRVAVHIGNPSNIYQVTDQLLCSETNYGRDRARYVHATDDYVYISHDSFGIFMQDRSLPGDPSLMGYFGDTSGVCIKSGDYLYSAGWDSGAFESFDLTAADPLPPEIGWVSAHLSEATGIVLIGDYIYVCGNNIISVVNISDPFNLIYEGRIVLYDVLDIVTDGQFIYAIVEDEGIYVIK